MKHVHHGRQHNKILVFSYKIQILINVYSLTAADGEGQQWIAAPACTASTELETKGSLAMSALTKMKFLATEMFMKYKCKMNIFWTVPLKHRIQKFDMIKFKLI
jgi:hypothetical protein